MKDVEQLMKRYEGEIAQLRRDVKNFRVTGTPVVEAREARFAPVCRKKACGQPCQWYGEAGGFSVNCEECNQLNATRGRQARARRQLLCKTNSNSVTT